MIPVVCARAKSVRNLDGILECFTNPKPLPADQLIERFAHNVLHRNEGNRARICNVVDVHNVGMVQSGGGFSLLHKAAPTVLAGQPFYRQSLQRDEPIQANIAGFPHSPHATFAELRFNAVMSERLTDHGSVHVLAVHLRPHPNSMSTGTTAGPNPHPPEKQEKNRARSLSLLRLPPNDGSETGADQAGDSRRS